MVEVRFFFLQLPCLAKQDAQPGAEMLPADWQIHGMRMHVGESQHILAV